MEKQKSNQSSVFDGFDIEAIEQGLSMKIPSTQQQTDSGGEGSGEEKEKLKVELPVGDDNLIKVPDTKEEWEQMYGKPEENTNEETIPAASGETDGGETKKEETDDTGQGEGEDAKIKEDSPLYLHAATLQEKGILPNLDLDELKELTYEEAEKYIFDKQQEYIDKGRDEYRESLTDSQKNYLEMIDKGVPDDTARQQASLEKAYGDLTDEVLADNEELMESVIYNANKIKGLKDEKIKVIIDKAREDEKLFEEAKDAKADIDAYLAEQKQDMLNKAQEREDEARREEERIRADVEKSVNETKHILPDIEVTEAQKKRILEYMTKPVDYVNHNGRRIPVSRINQKRNEDKINFDIRLNYYIELGLFDKDANLSKLMKKTNSTAAKRFSEKLRGDDTSESIKVNKPGGETGKKSKIIFPPEIQ